MSTSQRGVSAVRGGLRNPGRSVAEVMRTDFRSCDLSTSIAEVATTLCQARCPVLPVTRAQVPIGVVTEHRLAAALAEHGGDLSRLTAGDLMTADPWTVSIEAPIVEALGRFAETDGYLLAVDADGLLKGIVTTGELGPRHSEAALDGPGARVAPGTRQVGSMGPGEPPPSPGPERTPAEMARAADPTAEIGPSKSQAQPHPWDSPTGDHPEPIPLDTPSDLVNPMLKVSDAMTAHPRTCSPASSVLEAVLVFRDADCGLVPVTDGGRPVGVLTDRDIALALAEHETDLAGMPVESLMARDVVTIAADETLDAAIESLGGHGVRRLLAVDAEGKLVGVLSWADLVPHLSERGMGHTVSLIITNR